MQTDTIHDPANPTALALRTLASDLYLSLKGAGDAPGGSAALLCAPVTCAEFALSLRAFDVYVGTLTDASATLRRAQLVAAYGVVAATKVDPAWVACARNVMNLALPVAGEVVL